MDLMSLPLVMIENIFSYLSYDEIAKNRLVSKSFNEICSRMLNRGFVMIERRHALALKNVKAQLPRRESERRYHQLSRHCDILTSIETRISMLNMTYSKFIDHGLCCFIPGKVIDEIRRVLSIVERESNPPRAHEVLQELRDISSMAIEHFDDKISPALRRRLHPPAHTAHAQPSTAGVISPLATRQEMANLRRRSILNAKLSLYLASQYKKYYKRMDSYKKLAWRQHKIIKEIRRKQKDQDITIADLKKRIEECDIKYSELSHKNQTGGANIAGGTSEVTSQSTQPMRHFSSQIKLDLSVLPIGTSKRNAGKLLPNIKPRKPVIKMPSSTYDDKEPRKPKTEDPSTSRTKSQISLAKIKGITNEIRQLSNLSKSFEMKLKRPLLNNESTVECKKQKLD